MKYKIVTSLFMLAAWSAQAHGRQQRKANPRPTQTEIAKRAQQREEEDRKYQEDAQHGMEQYMAAVNPAFQALKPLTASMGTLGKYTVGEKPPKSIYSRSGADLEKYLAGKETKLNLTVTRQWLAGFHGLSPSTPRKDETGAVDSPDGIETSAEFLLQMIEPTLSAWAAEQRLALLHKDVDKALDIFAERLSLYEAFSLDSFEPWEYGNFTLDTQAALFAHSLKQFSAPQCSRLVALVDRWQAGRQTAQSGLDRTLQREMLQMDLMIPNSGDMTNDPSEALRKWQMRTLYGIQAPKRQSSAEDPQLSDDVPIELAVEAILNYDGPPTPVALERRSMARKALNESFAELSRFVMNPFAPLIEHPERPMWLRAALQRSATVLIYKDFDGHSSEIAVQSIRRNSVRRQMLGAHAAVWKFKLETGRWPATLAELNSPQMTTNPATKKPFDYAVAPDGYKLTCTGFPRFTFSEARPNPAEVMDLLSENLDGLKEGMSLDFDD